MTLRGAIRRGDRTVLPRWHPAACGYLTGGHEGELVTFLGDPETMTMPELLAHFRAEEQALFERMENAGDQDTARRLFDAQTRVSDVLLHLELAFERARVAYGVHASLLAPTQAREGAEA